MRTLAIVLVLAAGGCSWVTARANNNPRVGCSRTTGRIDLVFAIASAAGIVSVVAYNKIDPPSEGDHGGQRELTGLATGALLVFGLVEALQASYGLGVADRCEAGRAKLTTTSNSRPVDSPGAAAR